jgi:hypothetical protein
LNLYFLKIQREKSSVNYGIPGVYFCNIQRRFEYEQTNGLIKKSKKKSKAIPVTGLAGL